MKKVCSLFIFLFFSLSNFAQTANKTDLLTAIKGNVFNTVKQLVEKGANVNATDSNHASMLMWAVYKSDLQMVQYLVAKGATVNNKGVIYLDKEKSGYYGNLVGLAAGEGKIDVLKFLIEDCKINIEDKEYDPETKMENGWTALQWAASNNRSEIVKYLIENGSDINATTSEGTTPLMLAVLNDNLELCILIWKHKAAFNLKSKTGKTAKDIAIENYNTRIVDFLNTPEDYKSIQNKIYWKKLNTQSLELYRKGEYQNSILIAEKACDAAKKEFGEVHQNYITSLDILGFLFEEIYQYKKAEILYLQIKDIRKKTQGENHPDYANCLADLARVYSAMGEYTKAEQNYIRVNEIREKIFKKTNPKYSLGLNNLSRVYSKMGQYDKALHLSLTVLDMDKINLGESNPDYAISLGNVAAEYTNMGDYKKAETFFLQSAEIFKNVLGENNIRYVININNLGLVYSKSGDYKKAETTLLNAIELARKVVGENHIDYSLCIGNLGSLYNDMGLYEKAEPLFIQEKEIRKSIQGENHPSYANTLNSLAGLYQDMGQYEKAEVFFIQSTAIRKKSLGENHPDYAVSLSNLAALYQVMDQYKKAEPLYIAALAITKNTLGENNSAYAGQLANLGTLYYSLGRYDEAVTFLSKAKDILKQSLGESHPDYASKLHNLGVIYSYMGKYEKAEVLYAQAMESRKKILGENNTEYAESLYALALLYNETGRQAKAETYFLLNSQIVLHNISSYFSILSEKEKGNYLFNNISLLEANNSFVYNYKKASAAILKNNFDQQLFFKSLTLTATKNVLASVQQSGDTTVQKLLKDWQTNKSILAKQYSLSIAKRREDLNQIEDKTENQEKELSRKSSEFRKQQSDIHISLVDVQKNLQQNEAAIEFVRFRLNSNKQRTDSTLYAAYILNKTDSVPLFVPLCEEKQLQLLFDSAGNTVSSMVNRFYRGVEKLNKNAASLGKDLYKLVWAPLEPYLKGVKKISYSPAGKLYSIAFQALPVDSSMLLIDKYTLQQYTSTRQVALRTTDNQNIKPSDISLFGNASFTMDSFQLAKQKINKKQIATRIYTPQNSSEDNIAWKDLPGTAEEVKKIKYLFDQNKIDTKSFVQTAASEENLKALSNNAPQILHIATHGFFLPEPGKKKNQTSLDQGNTYTLADDPLLRSGLVLAGGNYAWAGKPAIDGVEDGIATAYEISQLNLSNTELVVLSACETALGDVKGSEGVFGLQRAFKMAGVKKMIVSLWQVPDKETAELMTIFYTYWMKGKTINESFTQAQAEMRKKYSPYYWAAFVLVE